MADKKLFLLDAYALIFRAYYAFIRNPRVTTKGLNTSAIYGFTNSLDELLRKENPNYIGVVFDPPGPNFRHEMYKEYKANRDATPEDIKLAVPYIKSILDAYNIPVIEVAGFEADDVIGTLANKAAKEGFDVFMMTPDKDFGQLVQDKVHMYKPAKGGADAEVWGVDEIKERFDLTDPKQVIDILALMGDSADNIPGCPGIGEKTAMKLIKQYGSVDGIYEHIHELKGKQKENLENFKEQVYLSYDLAVIKIDVPVDFDPKGLMKDDLDPQKLATLFEELEFRNMKNRILGETKNDPVQGSLFASEETALSSSEIPETGRENIESAKHKYILVDDDMKRASLRAELATKKEFCFDTETTGLNPLEAELVGLAFSYEDRLAFYVPVPENQDEAKKIVREFEAVMTDENIVKIGQNIKYDILVLQKYGLDIKGPVFDTMIAHYLIQPELKHNLDELAIQYLNYDTVKTEALIGKKGKNQLSMRDVEVDKVKDYAAEDADVTFRLKPFLEQGLKEEKIESLFYDLEMPLLKVLVKMEVEGVKLDKEALYAYSKELTLLIEKLEKDIIDMAGVTFNVASPKQVGEVLFEQLKIDEKAKKTKSGQYSTSEDVLVKLRNKHDIIDKILEFRGLKKLLNTYVDALPELINAKTGKIHTSFNQAIAATGRLSSTNPNLQNIPIRDEAGRELRKAFVPSDKEHVFFSADYSQVELRLMAHMSGDKNMLDAFNAGEDIHAATAAKIYDIPLADVDSDMRRKAKTANFGIIYGISAFGLSERLNIPRSEAKQLIDGYFETYPQIKAFMDESIKNARDKGFVTTVLGRRRYLPDINSRNGMIRGMAERNAINAPIQGSAADIIKLAMVKIQERFDKENIQSKMILQVHDELNFEVLKSELDKVKAIVVNEMEKAYKLDVPLTVDCGSGNNWLEAH